MAKKLWVAASVVLTLTLIGLVVADIYVSGQIESLLAKAGSEAAALAEKWIQIQDERNSTVFFAGVFFVIILVVVLKIGAEKRAPKGISQSEAQKIAAELKEEYKKSGVYVEAKEDGNEEEIITEMEMPNMKAVRFEGDKVVVEWYPVSNATGYYVWRKRGDEEWRKIKKIKKAVCSYKDQDIQGKTRYAYAVKSYYEDDATRVISKKDPLGMDIFVFKVQRAENAGEEA